jgi:lyso-ornithine lipid O-acyltransferase
VSGAPVSRIRASLALASWLTLTLLCMPVQLLALATSRRFAERFPVLYHRLAGRIIGAQVEVAGEISRNRPTLFVFNHVSWLDITIISSLMPCSFVAKAEVAGWPLFGWLAKLQRTVFIARRRHAVGAEGNAMRARLAQGDNLVLFAEGTSSSGTMVQPFKSAFFAIAEAAEGMPQIVVQPASISYTRLAGMPVGRQWRECFAWYGDMDLAPHLKQVFGLGRFTVRITFHPPLNPASFASRKALAEACLRSVSLGVARAHAGRAAPAVRHAA